MNTSRTIRTRIAPSPTGFPHVGTIYQAIIDKAIAKSNNGSFVVRIEDTDQTRLVKGAETSILQALDWLGLTEDEGVRKGGKYAPYRQSERLNTYKKYADKLIEQGHAYRCFCTKERLDTLRQEQQKNKKPPMYDGHCSSISKEESDKRAKNGEPFVVRMKVPKNQKIVVNDLLRGNIEFNSNTIDDQVIVKSDGFPTYHLAVVVDDHLMKISHVVRGPEWIPSFPKHALLYSYLGLEMPIFIHTPLITNMDGSKMSKRQAHTNIAWYREQGILPETLVNFLCLLGWSHPKQIEKFSYSDFIKNFKAKDLSSVNPKFDLKKLEWLNGQYIKELSPNDFYKRVIATNPELSELEEKQFKKILSQIQERVKKLSEVPELIDFFYTTPKNMSEIVEMANKESKLSTQQTKEQVKQALTVLQETENWDAQNIDNALHNLMEKSQIKPRQFFMPIRIVVSGKAATPPLGYVLEILGKQETIKRINNYLSY